MVIHFSFRPRFHKVLIAVFGIELLLRAKAFPSSYRRGAACLRLHLHDAGCTHSIFIPTKGRPATVLKSVSPSSDDASATGRDPTVPSGGGALITTRRLLVGRLGALLSVATPLVLHTSRAYAASGPSRAASAGSRTTSAGGAIAFVDPSEAAITDRVYVNVRISRQDGTFYVRDDLPDTAENRVFQGRLVVGLFGKVAPTSVERFLSYVDADAATSPFDENPMPTYGRSYFPALDPATGLLQGGTIPSLQITDVGGSAALRYGERLLPARLWIEPAECRVRVTHSRKGLLTHRVLDATPTFGITTRTDTQELDRTHTVFGALVLDEGDAAEFLDLVRDLPTYSVDRPPSLSADPTMESSAVDDAAELIFNAQRSFFRKTAKALGDTRLDKIYDGKILRRIEITHVGRLTK